MTLGARLAGCYSNHVASFPDPRVCFTLAQHAREPGDEAIVTMADVTSNNHSMRMLCQTRNNTERFHFDFVMFSFALLL